MYLENKALASLFFWLLSLVGLNLGAATSAQAHSGSHERLAEINHLMEHDGNSADLLLEKARLLIEQSRFLPAQNVINKVELMAPDYLKTKWVQGMLAEAQQDYKRAIAYYSEFLNRSSYHQPTLYRRAQCHLALNNTEQAIVDYHTLIATPDNNHTVKLKPDYFFELAELYASTKQFRPALDVLDQAMARFGLLPHLQRQAIAYEKQLGQYDRALSRHTSLQDQLGHTAQWQFEQAQLLQLSGNAKAAQALLQKALNTVNLNLQKQKRPHWLQLKKHILAAIDHNHGGSQ